MLPTFLGIGAQRTGTTWLHRVLSLHPEVYCAPEKEVHFFSQKSLWNDLDWYRSRFSSVVEPARGEITPDYATLSPAVVREIARLMPGTRVFITLRHPVERAWSGMRMLSSGWQSRGVPDLPPESFVSLAECWAVQSRNDYLSAIDTWGEAFGDALLVQLYDDRSTRPAEHLRELFTHLRVDPTWQPPEAELTQRVWSAPELDLPAAYRRFLARRWLEPTRRLNRRLDGKVGHWIESLEQLAEDDDGELEALRGSWRVRLRRATSHAFARARSAAVAARLRRWESDASSRNSGAAA